MPLPTCANSLCRLCSRFLDRKSTRLNSSHDQISYAVFCLKKKHLTIRMSRNFGMTMLTMTNLSTECLIQLTMLGYAATPFNQILQQNAKRETRLRLVKVTVADVLAAHPVTTNLLKFMRASIKIIGVSNLQSFIAFFFKKSAHPEISHFSPNHLSTA